MIIFYNEMKQRAKTSAAKICVLYFPASSMDSLQQRWNWDLVFSSGAMEWKDLVKEYFIILFIDIWKGDIKNWFVMCLENDHRLPTEQCLLHQ